MTINVQKHRKKRNPTSTTIAPPRTTIARATTPDLPYLDRLHLRSPSVGRRSSHGWRSPFGRRACRCMIPEGCHLTQARKKRFGHDYHQIKLNARIFSVRWSCRWTLSQAQGATPGACMVKWRARLPVAGPNAPSSCSSSGRAACAPGRGAGAGEQAAALASRLPAAGMFGLFPRAGRPRGSVPVRAGTRRRPGHAMGLGRPGLTVGPSVAEQQGKGRVRRPPGCP